MMARRGSTCDEGPPTPGGTFCPALLVQDPFLARQQQLPASLPFETTATWKKKGTDSAAAEAPKTYLGGVHKWGLIRKGDAYEHNFKMLQRRGPNLVECRGICISRK